MVGLAIGVLTFSPRWCEEVQATEPETPALDDLIKRFAAEERARCLASAMEGHETCRRLSDFTCILAGSFGDACISALNNVCRDAAQDAGGKVSEERARRALDQLDRETTTAIVVQLVRGKPESAKTILAANTTLNQAEVEQLIKGLSQEVSRYMQALQAQAKKAADYSAAVLWAVFISTSLGLIMAITGGRLGAQAGIRIYRRSVV